MITSQLTNWSFVTRNYLWSTSSSGRLVSSLGWCTLEQRRLLLSKHGLVLFFKFHNNLVGSQIPPELIRVQTNLLCYSFSFFPRAIRILNNLPQEAVNSASTEPFKNAAQKAIPGLKVPCHLKRFLVSNTNFNFILWIHCNCYLKNLLGLVQAIKGVMVIN